MNWGVFVCVGLWLTCVSVWLLETGRLQRVFATMAARWRRMPRGQVLTLFVLLVWAVVYGGGKDDQQQEGGQEDAEPPAIDMPVDEQPVDEVPVEDLPVDDLPTNDVLDPPPAFQMEPDGPMLLTFQGPAWPFDAFTSNAIAGMAATVCPPIPDDMLAAGLALYHVATNTVLVEDTDSVSIRAWSRHGADNRGVWVETPFPVTLGTNSYAGVGILANGRLAFGYATYHRQSTNGLPFATPYPVVTLAPLWGPFTLLPSAGSAGWTRTISTNRFIVCWENLLLEGDPGRPATVQCEIRRDGTIFFLYGSLADGAAAASTVGVQNLGQGWMYSHGHTNRLVAGMTVTLRPVGPGAWAEADPDNDAISNFDEFMIGTEPLLADTDGDGPSDFWELNHDFDPIVSQLAPPDPDTDGDGVPDRWEVWLVTPTNNHEIGRGPYLDPDNDGFTTWYETLVLESEPGDNNDPGAPEVEWYTDIMAVITSSVPCVLRLTRQSDNDTIEIPWAPRISPVKVRLRLQRGTTYDAVLSRVPNGESFTTDGFWWAKLSFEAVPNGITTTPVTVNGISTYYADTVRIRTPERGGDFWLVPGVAASPTNNLAAWKIKIESPDIFCYESTYGDIYLTEDSLFEGAIQWEYPMYYSTYTGNPLVFDPSTIAPGMYTVYAKAANNHLVMDVVDVEIRHIGVVQDTVWLSVTDTNDYTIVLSQDTYPTTGVDVSSTPSGINDLTFTPSALTTGVYTVYLDNGTCDGAQVTVHVLEVDLDVDADHDGNISVDDPDDPIEGSEGGVVCATNCFENLRKEVVLRKVEPSSWSGDVLLTKNSSKIRVFTAETNGTEITFDGSDNRFANTALPKSLWVQGEEPSGAPQDITLTFTSDPGGCADSVTFTVITVEPQWGAVDQFSGVDGPLSGSGDGTYLFTYEGIDPVRFTLEVNWNAKHFYESGFGHQFWLKVTPSNAPVDSVDMTVAMGSRLKGALINSGSTPFSRVKATWGMCEYLFPTGQLPQRVEIFSQQIDLHNNASDNTVNFDSTTSPSSLRTLKVGENEPGQFGPFADRYLIWLKVRGETIASSLVPLDEAKVDLKSVSYGGYITNKSLTGCSNPR